jgi:hypothetical protein
MVSAFEEEDFDVDGFGDTCLRYGTAVLRYHQGSRVLRDYHWMDLNGILPLEVRMPTTDDHEIRIQPWQPRQSTILTWSVPFIIGWLAFVSFPINSIRVRNASFLL